MATTAEAINSVGEALKRAMKRIEALERRNEIVEREVSALKVRPHPGAAQVTQFPAKEVPAIDPLLTTEDDGEFEDVG